MERISFKKTFDASRETVWSILWNDETYREWTSVFSEGSQVKTDWREGSKVLFLDGQGSGMVSRIAKKKENEFMSFEHLGEVRNGVEDTTSAAAQGWSGATEDYTLKDVNGKTELTVDIDVTDEFKDYFKKTWPLAFEKLKSIVERTKQGALT